MSKNPEQPPIDSESLEFEGTMPEEPEVNPEATSVEQDFDTLPSFEAQGDTMGKALGRIAISKVGGGAKKIGKWISDPSNPEQDQQYFDHLLDVAKDRAKSELTGDDYPELTLAPQTLYQRHARKRLDKDTEKLAEAKRYERVMGTSKSETSGRVRKIAARKARRDVRKSAKEKYEKGEITYKELKDAKRTARLAEAKRYVGAMDTEKNNTSGRVIKIATHKVRKVIRTSAKEKYEKGEITYKELKNAKLKAKRTWVTTGEDFVQRKARKRRERVEKAMVRTADIARGRREGEPIRGREGQEGYSGTMPIYLRTRTQPQETPIPQQEIENTENSSQPQEAQETTKRKKRKRKN